LKLISTKKSFFSSFLPPIDSAEMY